MQKDTVYKSIVFLNGDKCDVLMFDWGVFSKAMYKYGNQPKFNEDGSVFEGLDITTFVAERICLFNGKKKDIEFICKLSYDCYNQIMQAIGELMTTIK